MNFILTFTAEDMLSLGVELLNCEGKIIQGHNRRKEMVEELLNKSLILVPYPLMHVFQCHM